MLEVVSSGTQVVDAEVAVTKLIANVDEENWFVENDLLFDLSLHTFELLNRLLGLVTVHQGLREASSGFDIVIDPEFEGRSVQLCHETLLFRRHVLILRDSLSAEVPIVVKVADLVEDVSAFRERTCQKVTFSFESDYVEAVAGHAWMDFLSCRDGLNESLELVVGVS